MSFRCKQRLHIAPFCPVREMRDKTLETGEVILEAVDLSKVKLPDIKLFDLNNQLKAGVNLQEVNSKVFSSSKISGEAVAKLVGLETNQNNEVNDEN